MSDDKSDTFVYINEAQKEYFEYLDGLRASGITNMYGGAEYLRAEFPKMHKRDSYKILSRWMETFGERGCPGRDE
jgi:hypothetical protein